MRRWAFVAVPVGTALLVGAWWAADAVLVPPAPDLGPVVTVTPHVVEKPPTPPAPEPTPEPTPGEATVVPPAPPSPAGDDDDELDGDERDDDD
ncbi:hypothetical protein [Microbacterium sp. H1-D42]|uniref:hypothetical protein n=1 Tax=Microbacterium sp. H1-D42 TaxID=2925844 RepID=UPI001F52C5E6|nr:hypothetical protein [Microbacterium sp. H1-D42]UNK72194.1 hypothetical protein MNR00_07060 [Microbacterium sp. H1-D42]